MIKQKASESKPWWAPRVVPPKGAPNVLLIMTDDCGFGAPATFGGVIPTPALDRVAKNGLRYSNFHSTSLCSPTRAALITGRNHHVAGFGVVGELYNLGAVIILGLAGIQSQPVAVALWPAVVLHAVMTLLLSRSWWIERKANGTERQDL